MRNRFVVIALLVVAAAYIVIAANPPADKSAEAQAQPAAAPTAPGADAANPQAADSGDVSKDKKQYPKPGDMKIDKEKAYIATIETEAGTMVAELYPKLAPKTVNSFMFLAKEGFYDNVIFHRVIPGFMIQGGDPTGTGTGGPGYSVKAEFSDTKHERGILSMARSSDPDSAGSQDRQRPAQRRGPPEQPDEDQVDQDRGEVTRPGARAPLLRRRATSRAVAMPRVAAAARHAISPAPADKNARGSGAVWRLIPH